MNSHLGRSHLRAAAAAAGLLLVVPATSLATSVAVTGGITPDHGPVGTPLTITVGATLDPENGQSSVLRQIVMRFPRGAVHNGRLFPTCSAETINARKSFAGCPKGSQIGHGTGRGDVREVDTYNVPATLTMFNGPDGTITTHVYAENPALISQAIAGRIKRTSGRYSYQLTIPLPPELQEINDGWFLEVRSFSATVGATIRDRRTGRTRGFLESTRSCPASGELPFAAEFAFLRESAPAAATGTIHCRG